MKKLFSMLFIATMLSMVLMSCGDDKDEPEMPKTQNLESVHESENETYFVFDIDMNKDKSTIYMYNIKFAPAAPAMTLRVDVPVKLNDSGKAYILTGTDLVADMQRGGSWVPMEAEQYHLNNLTCTVNPGSKLYYISFDAHGGHFEQNGELK